MLPKMGHNGRLLAQLHGTFTPRVVLTRPYPFASNLVNGIKQEDGSIKSLTPRQVADLLGHSTSQITELYYVKKDTSRLHGITDGFNL